MTQAVAKRDAAVTEVCTAIAGAEMRAKLEQAVGDSALAGRIQRAALTAIQTNPAILDGNVSRSSVYNALIRCAQDGLLPDGREAAFVKYRKKGGGEEIQYQPMVGGFRKRAAEAGFSLTAHVVFAGDEFDYELGMEPRLVHKPPSLDVNRGNPIGAYAIAAHEEHGQFVEVMSRDEIEQIRATSRAKDNGPWVDHWGEMARKTVARRLFKQLPLGAVADRVTSMLQADELAFGPLGALPEVPVEPELEAGASTITDGDAEVVEGEVVEQEAFPIPEGAR